MKRLVLAVVVSLLTVFISPVPEATADSSVCHFESLSFYQWPGGGSIDSGISVGMSRQMKTFEPHKSDEACLGAENTMRGTVRDSVAHQGVVSWMLYGKTIPTETQCSVTFYVNQQLWMTASVSNESGFAYFTNEHDVFSQESLKSLLHLGRNILTSSADCGSFTDGTMNLNTEVDVLQDSFGEFSGVSINEGDDFTNTTEVKLNLSFDGIVAQVAVSNDGGFAKSQTQVFDYKDNTVTWKLRSSTSKLPRKVYVKYRLFDAANDSSLGKWEKEVYSDDIILDEIAPTISFIKTSVGTGRSLISLDRVGITQTKIRVLYVNADDDKSGVSHLQVSTALKGAPIFDVPTGKSFKVSIKKSRNQIFIRPVDSAGNVGSWRAVSTK
ncbi:MAG: hypothetical protein ACKOOD_02165 [Microbacteriaceae bacterium]